MELFRLVREKYSHELSGKGAAIAGGRWNSKGTEIIYTASNRSLAMAEIAVHFSWATLPPDYMMLTISCPDLTIKEISIESLPGNWDQFPSLNSTKIVGDKFISENEFPLFRIPSAVTKGDFNILINPFHKDFKKIKVTNKEPFPFDSRLFLK